jgi:glycine/D-amino acid oxidase-like deaminating enzyme
VWLYLFQWARKLGKNTVPTKVNIPLHACEHYYLVTKPMAGTNPMMPVVRDYDGYVYFREWNGSLLGGGFEPNPKPIFFQGPPDRFEFQLLQEDWDHFRKLGTSVKLESNTVKQSNSAKLSQTRAKLVKHSQTQ